MRSSNDEAGRAHPAGSSFSRTNSDARDEDRQRTSAGYGDYYLTAMSTREP
jgi:hypothetical protein